MPVGTLGCRGAEFGVRTAYGRIRAKAMRGVRGWAELKAVAEGPEMLLIGERISALCRESNPEHSPIRLGRRWLRAGPMKGECARVRRCLRPRETHAGTPAYGEVQ